MPPLSISEIFGEGGGREGGKMLEKRTNIAGKLTRPLKALFFVPSNTAQRYMQVFGVRKPVNMHTVVFLQQNLTNSP